MRIDELVARLELLPGAQIGCGPRHPICPRIEVAPQTAAFLESYPFAREDRGYVEFLERFSGATVNDPEKDIGIDIMGFDPRMLNLVETEGPIVDANGYLLIAMCSYGEVSDGRLDTWEYDFALDSTGTRKKGIYCLTALSGETLTEFEWHRGSFEEWIAELVEQAGKYAKPTSSNY
ncbi:hypothetical protein ACFVQ4_32715 [Streptomyces laurentii]|uniref:hypothetical protein n=1 Tax=Streptomyces laurentii TaxID=39478 RepID=UPI00368E8163